jgi:hypothetical protein
MQVGMSERWAQTDKSIYFVSNFTMRREAMDLKVNSMKIDSPNFLNDTIGNPKDYELGNNVLYNMTDVREFHFIVNGKQPEKGKYVDFRTVKIVAHECKSNCNPPVIPDAPCPKEIIKWSDLKTWDSNQDPEKRVDKPPPKTGDSFIIPAGRNVELDIAETDIFNKIEINGCLHFK